MTARDEAIAAFAEAIGVPPHIGYVATGVDAIPTDVLARLTVERRLAEIETES